MFPVYYCKNCRLDANHFLITMKLSGSGRAIVLEDRACSPPATSEAGQKRNDESQEQRRPVRKNLRRVPTRVALRLRNRRDLVCRVDFFTCHFGAVFARCT